MGLFKAKFLNYYLSENYEVNATDTDRSLIEKFINIESFKNIREKYSDIIEPAVQNIGNLDELPFQENLSTFKSAINQYPKFQLFLREVLKWSHENFVSIWRTFYFNDEYLFKKFSELMNSVFKDGKDKLLDLIVDFQKERKEGFSLFQKIQSTLDVSEIKTEVGSKFKDKSLTFNDLNSKQWDIIQRLNKKSSYEQQINVHNWCKELGNLIEDQFKRTIYYISSTNCLATEEKEYLGSSRFKSLSIRDVLLGFSKDFRKFKNLDLIYHLRNSTAHATFNWEDSQPIENSKIRFIDRDWRETLSFNRLLSIYFKLVTLIATFELVVMLTHLKLIDNSRPIEQVLKDIGNQLFQARIEIIEDLLKLSENDSREFQGESKNLRDF